MLASKEHIGDDRRDVGLMKAVVALLQGLGQKFEDIAYRQLMPNPPPKEEVSIEEEFARVMAYSQAHNQRWQRNQSEP